MKFLFIIFLLTFSLFASVIEKKDGFFLEIFSKKSSKSKVVAIIPLNKGTLNKKICSNTREEGVWCKVEYINEGVVTKGYVDKISLVVKKVVTKKCMTYETSYGGKRDDIGRSIIALKDGALIVGHTESFGAKGDDAYVIKVDTFGNKVFDMVFGGKQDDVLKDAVAIKDGFIVTGTSRSFGKSGKESMYIARLSHSGKLKWKHGYSWDDDYYYRGNSIIKTSEKNFIIAGNKEHKRTFSAPSDAFLNYIDNNGITKTTKAYGGDDKESINSIISTKNGFVFAGFTDTWGAGGEDMYVIKTNKSGDTLWHSAFGFKEDEVAHQIIATRDGGFILVGTTESFVDFQKDIFVVKINYKGKKEWIKHYGTQEDEEGFGIVEVNDGYLIAGYTEYTTNYKSNVELLKIDRDGNVMFTRQYGGERDDKAFAIAKLSDGFLITGYTSSPETYSKDVYILRVDRDGNID